MLQDKFVDEEIQEFRHVELSLVMLRQKVCRAIRQTLVVDCVFDGTRPDLVTTISTDIVGISICIYQKTFSGTETQPVNL